MMERYIVISAAFALKTPMLKKVTRTRYNFASLSWGWMGLIFLK